MKESRILRRAREEGELLTKRADILEAIEARFGAPAAADLSAAINALDDLERATRIFRLVLRSSTLEQVRSALSEMEQAT